MPESVIPKAVWNRVLDVYKEHRNRNFTSDQLKRVIDNANGRYHGNGRRVQLVDIEDANKYGATVACVLVRIWGERTNWKGSFRWAKQHEQEWMRKQLADGLDPQLKVKPTEEKSNPPHPQPPVDEPKPVDEPDEDTPEAEPAKKKMLIEQIRENLTTGPATIRELAAVCKTSYATIGSMLSPKFMRLHKYDEFILCKRIEGTKMSLYALKDDPTFESVLESRALQRVLQKKAKMNGAIIQTQPRRGRRVSQPSVSGDEFSVKLKSGGTVTLTITDVKPWALSKEELDFLRALVEAMKSYA
jgi:hypothetical protein